MASKNIKSILQELQERPAPIKSLLENDLYKWSMAQFVTHRYPGAWVRVTFKCRSDYKVGFLKPVIDKWLDEICELRYTKTEIEYLRGIDWLSEDFVDYLRRFYLFREQVHTGVDSDGQLIMWAEGPWRDVIWFEVPCLALVEEAYMSFRLAEMSKRDQKNVLTDAASRLAKKIALFNDLNGRNGLLPFTLSEFGIRRRFSRDWQDHVVKQLTANCWPFVGTSDVYLAKKYKVKPMGTMAHELYMGLQGCKVQLREVQRETWRQWMDEYRGKNGILLSDIFGFNACLNDMDWYVANSFQGCRHDSGDPFTWGEKLIAKYESLGIDPATKVGCWSDNLNPELAARIYERFSGRIKVSFGIGTNLVNDTAIEPLSIVMKLTYAGYDKQHMIPVLKLSDSPGKGMCPDPALVEYAKHVYGYRQLESLNEYMDRQQEAL